ncbi:MAG: hypothetical protein BWZ10_03198 [candidate division BRC1 bacterium ADurb.BinA364]|nr:MAG: hypothetical protein BWZ10_03198 [candidate division BRC1 bacterium ADurb.BinA364]
MIRPEKPAKGAPRDRQPRIRISLRRFCRTHRLQPPAPNFGQFAALRFLAIARFRCFFLSQPGSSVRKARRKSVIAARHRHITAAATLRNLQPSCQVAGQRGLYWRNEPHEARISSIPWRNAFRNNTFSLDLRISESDSIQLHKLPCAVRQDTKGKTHESRHRRPDARDRSHRDRRARRAGLDTDGARRARRGPRGARPLSGRIGHHPGRQRQ